MPRHGRVRFNTSTLSAIAQQISLGMSELQAKTSEGALSLLLYTVASWCVHENWSTRWAFLRGTCSLASSLKGCWCAQGLSTRSVMRKSPRAVPVCATPSTATSSSRLPLRPPQAPPRGSIAFGDRGTNMRPRPNHLQHPDPARRLEGRGRCRPEPNVTSPPASRPAGSRSRISNCITTT